MKMLYLGDLEGPMMTMGELEDFSDAITNRVGFKIVGCNKGE